MGRKAGNRSAWMELVATAVALWMTSPSLAQDLAFGANRWKCCPQPLPQTPERPRLEAPPSVTPPVVTPPPVTRPEVTPPQVPLQPTLPPEQFAALGGETVALGDRSAVGYIDPAIPLTQFRLRYDAAYRDNRPDRAEFFYPKCG